jgi:hypothetical protein
VPSSYACCGHCDHEIDPPPHEQPCNGERDEGCEPGSARVPAGEAVAGA